MVSARCLRRSESSGLDSRILWPLPLASTPGTVPSAARWASRRISRCRRKRTTNGDREDRDDRRRLGQQPVRRLGEPALAEPVVDAVAERAGLPVVDAALETDGVRQLGGQVGRERHGRSSGAGNGRSACGPEASESRRTARRPGPARREAQRVGGERDGAAQRPRSVTDVTLPPQQHRSCRRSSRAAAPRTSCGRAGGRRGCRRRRR